MKIELELWHMILLLLAFFGACSGAGKMLLTQTREHLDSRFDVQETGRATFHQQLERRLDSMEATSAKEATGWQQLERELLILKADLPLHYVRREDYIRGQSVLEAKMDAVVVHIQNLQLKTIQNMQLNAHQKKGDSHAN